MEVTMRLSVRVRLRVISFFLTILGFYIHFLGILIDLADLWNGKIAKKLEKIKQE